MGGIHKTLNHHQIPLFSYNDVNYKRTSYRGRFSKKGCLFVITGLANNFLGNSASGTLDLYTRYTLWFIFCSLSNPSMVNVHPRLEL